MNRFIALSLLLAAGCGRLFMVGDETKIKGKLLADGGVCSAVACTLACQDGFQTGPDGCEICACNPPGPVQCGNTTCAAGQVCCDPSCGICGSAGGACPAIACVPNDAGPQCPAIACTLACQYGFQRGPDGCEICACNPPPGPVQCGPNTCAAGEVCCNESCGICTAPDGACTQQFCEPLDAGQGPVQCGPNVCASGEVCCNESCGICTPPNGVCTQQACAPADAGTGTACGFNTCAPGTECCNPSCGICVPPGFACTQQVCACPPVVCTLACQYGFQRGPDGCEICACAPPPVTCGSVTCGAGLECCNASCGICAPPGSACIQIACN
jgi:hypothetical protein